MRHWGAVGKLEYVRKWTQVTNANHKLEMEQPKSEGSEARSTRRATDVEAVECRDNPEVKEEWKSAN